MDYPDFAYCFANCGGTIAHIKNSIPSILPNNGDVLCYSGICPVSDRKLGAQGMEYPNIVGQDCSQTSFLIGFHFGIDVHSRRSFQSGSSVYNPLFGLYDL